MIHIKLEIANPMTYKNLPVKDFNYCFDKAISKNKSFEFQAVKFSAEHILSFGIDTRWWGRDHAGPELTFEFCGIIVEMRIYDHRHWDHEADTWEKY
jgi:hypothetical protein